jgi:SAM-dependent methyltransferase
MWPDVVDLRDFYASSLGQVTCRLVRRQIRTYWTDTTGMNVLGIGFATPYMLPFCDEASRVSAIMPARMGVLAWSAPTGGEGNAVCLSVEGALPFPDLSIDRILVVHGLEYTEQVNALLREVWRVLADGGRLLVVVPNRRGPWAHADDTPFGHGHPYSLDQLNAARGRYFCHPRAGVSGWRRRRPGRKSARAGSASSAGLSWSRRQNRSMPARWRVSVNAGAVTSRFLGRRCLGLR